MSAINVNSTQFLSKENVVTFHNGNGWNYGYKQNKNGSFVLFRYYTNGHQNESITKRTFNKGVALPDNAAEAESLFHS